MKADFPAGFSRSENLVDIPELARSIGRYKWGFVGITVLAAALATLAAFIVPPEYRGTASVLVELQPQRVVQIQDVYDPGTGLNEYYWTQTMVLRSREMAERIVDKLGLVDHPAFSRDESSESGLSTFDLRQYLPLAAEVPVVEMTKAEQRRTAVVDAVMSKLTIEPVMYTQIIKVHFNSNDPQLAADVPNTLADLYIESGLEAKLDATSKATQWLTTKLGDIRENLARSEAALQAFLEQEQLVNVGGARTLTEDELLDYSRRLREAQRKRAEYQAAYGQIRSIGNDPEKLRSIGPLLNDPLVEQATQSYLAALEAAKQLEERYGSKHPQMATARARLASAEAAFNDQLRNAARGLQTEFELAQANEQALQARVNETRSQIQRLDRKNYELSSLQRDVETNRELYDTFLTRFKETDTTAGYETLIARIIDRAVIPQGAYSPNKLKWIMLGAAAGFLLSLVLGMLHYALSEGIRSADELEGLTQLPVFGVLPLIAGLLGKRKNIPMLYIEKPRTPLAEGVRSINAALKLSDSDRHLKRLMVTSAVPSEGKSSVCSALAISLGASERALLIETDLRKPSLRKQFNLSRDLPGLADILAGKAKLDDCLFDHAAAGITILLAGSIPANPAEMLSSENFRLLLDELDTRYDRLVLDSPPCQAAADALVLARLVQGVLFVVKSESTPRRSVKNSLKQLRYVGAPVTGLVVNQVDTRRNASYAQGYYYAYNYYS